MNGTSNNTVAIDEPTKTILKDEILKKACLTDPSNQEAPTVNDYNSEADFLYSYMKVNNFMKAVILKDFDSFSLYFT